MGSTTRYGVTYPELSAVPNAPSQMQTMANTIDTALGTAVDNVAGLTAGRTDQLMNGNFLINQRAASSYTASAASGKYTVDRWYLSSGTGASNTVTPTAETLGTYADHDRYYLEWDRTTAGSADSYLEQRIEGVRTGNGTSITVAILADVASSTANLKVEVVQNFGTGGSPSTAVTTTSTALTISTSNTAQYKTISIPSISGKTIGSNGDDYVAIRLTRESGYGTGKIRLHRVGATLGTAQVWPDKRPKQQELALCQRYYFAPAIYEYVGGVWSTTQIVMHVRFPVTMRTTPTAVYGSGTWTCDQTGIAPKTSTSTPNDYGITTTKAGFWQAGCTGATLYAHAGMSGIPSGTYYTAEL